MGEGENGMSVKGAVSIRVVDEDKEEEERGKREWKRKTTEMEENERDWG